VHRCEGAHPLRAARRGPPPRPLRGLPRRITRARPGRCLRRMDRWRPHASTMVSEKEGPPAIVRVRLRRRKDRRRLRTSRTGKTSTTRTSPHSSFYFVDQERLNDFFSCERALCGGIPWDSSSFSLYLELGQYPCVATEKTRITFLTQSCRGSHIQSAPPVGLSFPDEYGRLLA
jgi:hypothetical protein